MFGPLRYISAPSCVGGHAMYNVLENIFTTSGIQFSYTVSASVGISRLDCLRSIQDFAVLVGHPVQESCLSSQLANKVLFNQALKTINVYM